MGPHFSAFPLPESERQACEQRGHGGYRDWPEAQKACLEDRLFGAKPSPRSAEMAKSIIRTAFFFTIPISRMMPISVPGAGVQTDPPEKSRSVYQ